MNYWDLIQWLSLGQSGAKALKWTDSLIGAMPIFAKNNFDWDNNTNIKHYRMYTPYVIHMLKEFAHHLLINEPGLAIVNTHSMRLDGEKRKYDKFGKDEYIWQIVLDIFSLDSSSTLACMGATSFVIEGRSPATFTHTFPVCLVPIWNTAKYTPVKLDLRLITHYLRIIAF
jgi:hypothetical protein